MFLQNFIKLSAAVHDVIMLSKFWWCRK